MPSLFSQIIIIPEYAATDTVMVVAERDQVFPQMSSIATKSRLPLQLTPFAINAVSNQINQNQGNTVLSETMNNISGANIQTGFGIHDYFVLRGFNTLDNGLVLTDGTIEPEVIIYNLYNVEQVEILKGPGAFLYGGKPLSGTINLMRKQPNFSNFLNVSGMYGSFNSYRGLVDAGFVGVNNHLSGRFNGIFQQSDFYRDDKNNKIYAVNPAITWRIDNKTEMNVNAEYFNSEYKPDSGLPLVYNYKTGLLDQLADVKRTNSYQTPEDYSDQNMLRLKLNLSRQLGEHSGITNKFYYTNLDWKSNGTLLMGAFPGIEGGLWVNRTLQKLDDQQALAGNQLELTTQFKTATVKHNLLVGFEVSQWKDDFTINVVPQLPLTSLNNPVETYDPDVYPAYPYQAGDVTSTVLAPYFLDIINIFSKTSLIFGGRYDYIDFDKKKSDLGEKYNSYSPSIGISYSPQQSLTLYANAGQAFAPPSSRLEEKLDPEKSSQLELGIKKIWLNGKIRSTVSVYQLDKENIAIPDKNGFTQQVGSQQAQGVEVDILAQMTDKCASIFTYAYTNSKMSEFNEIVTIGVDNSGRPMTAVVDRSGNSASFAPQNIVSFWHNREIGQVGGFGAGVRYVSSQYIAEDNIYKIDGYVTFDAMVYYQLGKTRWQFNLKNISSSKYEMRGFGGYSVIPAPPFSIHAGVHLFL